MAWNYVLGPIAPLLLGLLWLAGLHKCWLAINQPISIKLPNVSTTTTTSISSELNHKQCPPNIPGCTKNIVYRVFLMFTILVIMSCLFNFRLFRIPFCVFILCWQMICDEFVTAFFRFTYAYLLGFYPFCLTNLVFCVISYFELMNVLILHSFIYTWWASVDLMR